MLTLITHINQIRITEDKDWVIWSLIGAIVIYIIMMNIVEKESSIKEFILQKHFDSSNNFVAWLMTGFVMTIALTVLLSQSVPIVPKFILDHLQIFGFQVNKAGYAFLVIAGFYLTKALLGYFFFQSTGDGKKWSLFCYNATKFYMILSIFILLFCFIHHYYFLDKVLSFYIQILFLTTVFCFKIVFYLFHKNQILPRKWYYKFLYICTLQTAPLMLLWKLLFL